jgi:hypothetical protein
VLFYVLLVLNALWFGVAFVSFGLTPRRAARLITPREYRDLPTFAILARSIVFLGGLNLALAVLAIVVLAAASQFPNPLQRVIFLGIFALAHGTQFAVNVPIALSEPSGKALWPVRRGPMLFIFVIDGTLMLCNAGLGLLLGTSVLE